MRRRMLLRWISAAAAWLPFAHTRAWAAAAGLSPKAQPMLRALAAVVLPASLGRARTEEVADGFLRWVRGYRAGAELDHGYGVTRLRFAPPSFAGAYAGQLARLDGGARARGAASFTELPLEGRRALVEAAMERSGVRELPERPEGKHVAADLMAFFFRSSEANDLCYGAAIGRTACLGLPGSEEAPAPLAPES